MILLIDNYDSFTWNLVQGFLEISPGEQIKVVRNDQVDLDEAIEMAPDRLVISPGPCTPEQSGISRDLIRHFKSRIPILGVCLGHQAIGDADGMTVLQNDVPMHGKTSMIHHDGRGIFRNMSNPFQATRYHSLVISRETIPDEYQVSAWTERDEVMGIRLVQDDAMPPLDGVQFHPESFLTLEGPRLLGNFLGLDVTGRGGEDHGTQV